VLITDGQDEHVTVTNTFAPVPPEPPEPPVPPQPPLPPGPPEPLPGPDLTQAPSLDGGADLQVSERISPRRTEVGRVVTVTVTVRNDGPLPADGAVVREIPQVDPRHPNQVATVLGVAGGVRAVRATSICTNRRPVRCGPATLAVGAVATVRVRARMLRPGAYKSVVVVTATTPDTNTTNNATVSGLVVRRVSKVAVAVHAPASTGVGDPVSYRVVARGAGSDGADSVRFCHRPPAGLLMTSAPGTFRFRGQVCRDVARLRAGQRASFTVHAIAAARAAGRTLRLHATATAPDAAIARGSGSIAVLAQTFAGTG
jgi:hypothetical protein